MKTKKRGFLARFLGALFISGLALPGPVHALRPELSPKTKTGIEDALAAGMEEMDPVYVWEAVQGLYQFPALVEKHFGKDGARPARWDAFLEAAGRESSWTWDGGLGSFWKLPQKTRQGLAYRSLRNLPAPLRFSVGGELVLHNQKEGVLLLGEHGAEPSLLAIFMTGDSLRGWSRHNRWEWITSEKKNKHTWTYLGGDLLVLEFPQGLYAGRLPRKNGQHKPLTTRFPLEWATEVSVHEGPFEGRAFQTEIEGKNQFVPLKGVVRFSRNELMDLRTASLPSNGNLSGSLQKLPAQDLFVDISQLRWRNDWDKDPKRKIALQNLQGAVRTVEDFFVPQFSAGSEESSSGAKAVLEDARRFLSEGNYRVDRLAEAIRDLQLLEQPPEGELSPEGWVRAFIRQMRVEDGLPLDGVLLDQLTAHSRDPYSAGPFSRGEVQGRPEDKELLEGTLGEAKRVLLYAGAQLGLTPEHALEKLKWESLERFERYLYDARDTEGDLFLRDVPVETMIRWFYRQIPQRLIPAVADRVISRTDLARALGNPFRLANEQGNQVTADLIQRLLADGVEINGRRLTGDPTELAKDPSLVIPWIRLQMATNLVDYSNPKILEAIAAEEGNNDAEKLTGYLRKRLETPFAWGAYNERDLEDYVRSVLRAGRPAGGYVEEVVFGDNNAQLVATLKLIEAKLSANPHLRVRLVLKGDNGVMNDASGEDGEALLRAEPEFYRLLLQYRREDRFEILTGPRSHGTPLDLISEEVARALLGADAVFAEGEANTITLNGLRGNLYLSLRLKAPLFIRHVVGVDPEEMKDYPPAFLAVRGGRYYDRVLASAGPEGGRVTIEDHWARPNRVRFQIRPGAKVFGQLPSGEELEIYIRKGKSSGQSRVVATAPIGWVHYRGRSLREGAVGQYTLQKTEKILDIKEREIRENHRELYERPVDLASQGIFFLPLPSVRDLLGRRASMREWRMAAPYVFRFIHRLPDGSAEVELRYREPVEVVSDPAAGLEEKARVKETIMVPVADQLVVGILAHSPGIRGLEDSLGDSGIQVKEVKDPWESAELLRAELVGLLILAPEDSETGDWRGGTAVPTVVMPAFVAVGLTERELAALAEEARARGGILHINGITQSGAEEQSSFIVLHMT